MSDQTSTVRIISDSAATSNTVVRVELTAATFLVKGLVMLSGYNALTYPKERKRKSYVERKLRKMGR
ncbi:hypothetical protein MUO79_10230 [Candidatus Bathyarchaeota archaeon]|nr:hypothetical protein [Candidatus Bathyarchaeota archaeon]